MSTARKVSFDEFLVKLGKHRGKFGFLFGDKMRDKQGRCPIEVVAGSGPRTVFSSGTALNLPGDLWVQIIRAADGHGRVDYRAAMLGVLGLTEPVQEKLR